MAAEQAVRTAVLIVRLWRDTAGESGLRARILWTQDVEREPETVSVARDADTVLATVQGWLDEFLGR
jgi:hypothetical protein